MGILDEIRGLPKEIEYWRHKSGPGTAILVIVLFVGRLLVPLCPLAAFGYFAYVTTRGPAPVSGEGKVFLIVGLFCALGLAAFANSLLGSNEDSNDDDGEEGSSGER